MTAPTGSDGFARAIAEFAAPSVGVIVAVAITKQMFGGLAAGLIYLLLLTIILSCILISANNWNIRYTAAFGVAGLVFFRLVSNMVSEFIHPVFTGFGQLLVALFFIGIFVLFARKTGLDEVLGDW